MRPDFKVWIRF